MRIALRRNPSEIISHVNNNGMTHYRSVTYGKLSARVSAQLGLTQIQEESHFLHAATGRAASYRFPLPIITAQVLAAATLTHSSVMVGALQ